MCVSLVLMMCYLACYKGSIGAQGEDFNELPCTEATNTTTTETIDMSKNLKEENRKMQKIPLIKINIDEERNIT